MIPLQRTALTNELSEQVDERIARLQEHLNNGTNAPDALLAAYRNPAVKAHLIAEAHGKCIYCESKVSHVYYGDVEHIKPKAIFPALRLNMDNLGLACALCNGAKGDYWDEQLSILNPYQDDPSNELIALGFYVQRRPGRDRARITVERLGLNRQALLERRKERVELLQPLVDQYAAAPPGPLKELLLSELLRQADDSGEYAMTVRAFLRAVCDIEA